jgi:hypothetical protein
MTNVHVLQPDRPPGELEHWAGAINDRLGRAVGAIIEAGRLLVEAKARLKHGEWERLFRGHPHAVPNAVPISVSTGQRLMAIARHPILSNPAHAQHLPRSWTTLYQLTKIDAATLRQSIKDGQVHPGLGRRQAAALTLVSSRPDGGGIVPALRTLRRRLDAVRAACPPAERAGLARLLRHYADGLDADARHRDVAS